MAPVPRLAHVDMFRRSAHHKAIVQVWLPTRSDIFRIDVGTSPGYEQQRQHLQHILACGIAAVVVQGCTSICILLETGHWMQRTVR